MPEFRTFQVGTGRYRHTDIGPPETRTAIKQKVTVPEKFDFKTERRLYRNYKKPGFHYEHVRQRPPTLYGLRQALKQVKTPTFSIRVLGKLAETPENYPDDDYPPFEYLYLGNVRNTANALASVKQAYATYGNDWFQMREWVNDWSNFKWSEIATVYISER